MINRNKPIDLKLILLWGICSIEALLALTYLLALPTNTKSAILAGYSAARLSLAACLVFGLLICLWFLITIWKLPASKGIVFSIARLELAQGPLFFVAVLISCLCIFLMILPPPSLRGVVIERFIPLLIWVSLCGLQIAFVIAISSKEKVAATAERISQFFNRIRPDIRVGFFLLLLSFIFGLITLAFTYYNVVDEGDTIYGGWLHSNGIIFYRDFFSQRFPFSLLWVSSMNSIFGDSIPIYRLSLLLLRIVMFGITMIISRDRFIVGMVSLSWSIIGPLYLGNMVLYYSFESIFIICAFFILYALLKGEVGYQRKTAIWIGVLVGLALLSDPLMYLPAMIILIFLILAGLKVAVNKKEKIINVICPIIGPSLLFLVCGGYLIATSSLNDFFQDTVLFNLQVYTKYTVITPSIVPFFRSIITGLDVFSPAYRQITDPYYDWYGLGFLGTWIFTALFFRLAVLGYFFILILRKNTLSAVFFYLLACSLYVRGPGYYFQSAFIITAITAASFIAFDFFTYFSEIWKVERSKLNLLLFKHLALITIAGIITLMFCWINLQLGKFWVQRRSEFTFEKQFSQSIIEADHYRSLTCGNEDATFLYYPYNPIIAYFTKLPPSSRYVHMGAMVASAVLQDAIADLDGKVAIVYIDKDGDLGGYKNSEYLSDLINFLDTNYIEVEENVYISPMQYEFCNSLQNE